MSLLNHIDTADVVDLHDDIRRDAFPEKYWQRGTDGVITGMSVPCAFSSESLNLNHYIPDDVASELDNDAQKVKSFTDNVDYVLPVLNIHGVGFFRFTSITDNRTGTIEYMSPSSILIINRGLSLNLDETDITAATGLKWSLGGVEEKVAKAYCTLLQDLINRRAITGESLTDNDPTYDNALIYRTLYLVYNSLRVTPDDLASSLTRENYQLYQKELSNAKPYGYKQKAVETWERA